MKKLILFLMIIVLAGCQVPASEQTISTHQPLQTLDIARSSTDGGDSGVMRLITDEGARMMIATQEEFVYYMYESISSLEKTLSLLDTNLKQIFSIFETGDYSAELAVRQKLLDEVADHKESLTFMLPFNDVVRNLHHYVIQAYTYNLAAKAAEYNIYAAVTLTERQTLLDNNAETQHLAAHYLGLAWSELSSLSTMPISAIRSK